jgi:RimJ/RimL family protein N-acetyltransferase
LACEWGFTELGLGRIEWQAYVENAASRRVAEKVGFHIEGLVRQRLVQRGVRRDAYIGSLLPGELVPYADLTGRREA